MAPWILALAVLFVTAILVLWRPGNIHEAIPALIGAGIALSMGLVGLNDVFQVAGIVWNAALTIIATFVMAIVLEETGFFRWAAERLVERSGGSPLRLFKLVLLFSAFLTLLLNNDGSIILGTPVVINVIQKARLPRSRAFSFLIGACFVASASSTVIGVSNMANLEAMALTGISLVEHLTSLLIPGLTGLATVWALLILRFRTRESLPTLEGGASPPQHSKSVPFMRFAVVIVILVRAGVYWAAEIGVATYLVSMIGALILLLANVHYRAFQGGAALVRAPWLTLLFAFGMDLTVFALRGSGLTAMLASGLGPTLVESPTMTSVIPGALAASVSALLNNHPALISTTLILLDVDGLSDIGLKIAHASTILGSDLGALITPNGTLATLLWFHTLRQNGFRHSWKEYLAVSFLVIPLSFATSLLVLGGIAHFLF